jgi:hypothetical protein
MMACLRRRYNAMRPILADSTAMLVGNFDLFNQAVN